MKRRTFIKGVIATGIVALTPLKLINTGFRPRPYQMAHAQEFMRGMSRTVGNRIMYGRSYAGESMGATNMLTGLMKKI